MSRKCRNSKRIREQDPLKQGLKQQIACVQYVVKGIREQDPLKQGLKLLGNCSTEGNALHSRARSTKTRIETDFVDDIGFCEGIREQDPLKQGLKLHFPEFNPKDAENSRARSTKTRIET